MITPTAQDEGRRVVYRPRHGDPEEGVLRRVTPHGGFVVYAPGQPGKLTRFEDLDCAEYRDEDVTLRYAKIDYGSLVSAELWTEMRVPQIKGKFYHYANQCFGIRKSIMQDLILETRPELHLPKPWNLMDGAATMLKHSGETIIWNKRGEKIKSEFD